MVHSFLLGFVQAAMHEQGSTCAVGEKLDIVGSVAQQTRFRPAELPPEELRSCARSKRRTLMGQGATVK
jgi:hypothetical protein